jgi:diguanylate cyclase
VLAGVVACGVAFAGGAWSAPHTGVAAVVQPLLLNAVHVAAVVLCLRAARRAPEERLAWWGGAVAWLLNLAGNVLFALTAASAAEPPFPSVADAAWLASYPALYVVAVVLLVVRVRHLGLSTWLDGLIGALGITAVAATLFITPAVHSADLDAPALAATYAYPVADVLLLALLGAVMAILGLRGDLALVLLCGILGSKLLGDLLLTAAQAGNGYVAGGPIDLTWMANAVFTGLAANAARPRDAVRSPAPTARTGWRVVTIPLGCNVASLGVLASEWGAGTLSVGGACALGCVVAALARTAVTFQETRTLHEVSRQAGTDELTGLPNRRTLLTAAERQLARSGSAALLLLDLDGFKAVNDGLGHAAGDELLRRIGQVARQELRPDDVLARLGGDEFAVLLPDTGAAAAEECARRLRAVVLQPLPVAGTAVRVGVSIGVATAPDPARTVVDLLQQADAAMYAAKAHRDGVRVHPAVSDRLGAAVSPAPDRAGDPVRFRVVPGRDGRPALVEAVLAPPAACATAPDLLEQVLRAVAGWWPDTPVPVQLPLGAADLGDARLPDRLGAALLRHGLPPGSLELRVDQGPLQAFPDAVGLLHAVRARGIRTAVQAPGAGLLTLAAIRDLPADRLHLDSDLTDAVDTDPRAALVVEHTVALARALGHAVMADATTGAAAVALAGLGCDVRPDPACLPAVPAAEVATRLQDGAVRLPATV